MSINRYISIKISGTPVRKGGFIPIVNINDAFFEIKDAYPAILSRDTYVYSVSVEPDATVYKLVFNGMRHRGDNADARLVIGFSVPEDYSLPDNTDAVTVLHTLLQAFLDSFAVALPDGSYEYRFGRYDTSALEKVCTSMPLVRRHTHRVLMSPGAKRGAITTVAANIAAVMADTTGREDMAQISELLVSEHINASVAGVSMPARIDEPDLASIYADEARAVADEADGAVDGEDIDISIAAQANNEDNVAVISGSAPVADYSEEDDIKIESPAGEIYPGMIAENGDTDGDLTYARRKKWLIPVIAFLILVIAALSVACFWIGNNNGGNTSDTGQVTGDTVEIIDVVDTVLPERVETVFIEKKVIIEKVILDRLNKGRLRSSSGAVETTDPASQEETGPEAEPAREPVLKYDPEVERSL